MSSLWWSLCAHKMEGGWRRPGVDRASQLAALEKVVHDESFLLTAMRLEQEERDTNRMMRSANRRHFDANQRHFAANQRHFAANQRQPTPALPT